MRESANLQLVIASRAPKPKQAVPEVAATQQAVRLLDETQEAFPALLDAFDNGRQVVASNANQVAVRGRHSPAG